MWLTDIMSDEIKYKNNPLNGVSLKKLVTELASHYGFDILHAYLNINCFKTNPSVDSSVKFLKKTDWAREKVEGFYMYDYKSFPRATAEQYQLPPRDRIVPDDHCAGEPKVLSLEDAQRLQEKRAKKAAERKQGGFRTGGGRNASSKGRGGYDKRRNQGRTQDAEKSSNASSEDPWANWR